MKAVASTPFILPGKQAIIRHLTSNLTSALRDRKPRNRGHAISRLAERVDCLGQSNSQWADHACSHNGDASTHLFCIRAAWVRHGLNQKLDGDFYCFLRGSILQVSPNENGSPEVGGLSVEFIQ